MTTQETATIDQLSSALHEMCQPLTALMCVLDIADTEESVEGVRLGITAALRESERLRVTVLHMRKVVQAAGKALDTGD